MFNSTTDPRLGSPYFAYKTPKERKPNQYYSIRDIRSALRTLVSKDSDNLVESTLEAILDLVYYPDHLGLLANPGLTPALFKIFKRYPNDRIVCACSPTILLLILHTHISRPSVILLCFFRFSALHLPLPSDSWTKLAYLIILSNLSNRPTHPILIFHH